MATNSSTRGFLAPLSEPVYGDALDDVFHDLLVGITGIANDLVRPRWQPEPPNQPDFSATWVAFGVTITQGDVFSYQAHDPSAGGFNVVERDEVLTVLQSYYGPNGQAAAQRFNAGIQVEQNRDTLTAVGIKFVECQEINQLPALLKEKWVRRFDCRTIYRRRVRSTYPILDLVADPTGITLDNEHYITTIDATKP